MSNSGAKRLSVGICQRLMEFLYSCLFRTPCICCPIKLLCDIYATSYEIPCFHRSRYFITLFTNSLLSANSLVRNLYVSHILILSCHLCLGLSSGLYYLHSVGLDNEVLIEVMASLQNNSFIVLYYYT
jgi:hypothetical protein